MTVGQYVFVDACGPLDKNKKVVVGGIKEQTKQAIQNLKAILEAAGSSLTLVARTTVFLTDINNLEATENVYEDFFPDLKHARSTVPVVSLAKGGEVLIAIECIAESTR